MNVRVERKAYQFGSQVNVVVIINFLPLPRFCTFFLVKLDDSVHRCVGPVREAA